MSLRRLCVSPFDQLFNWELGDGVGSLRGAEGLVKVAMCSPGGDSGSAFLWCDFVRMLVVNASTSFRVFPSQDC